MTFEEFQATGRDVADIGAEVDAPDLAGIPGRVYAGDLHIEVVASGWRAVIGNREHRSADLAEVERALYQFAVDEGIAR
jgi:hypothetical protein